MSDTLHELQGELPVIHVSQQIITEMLLGAATLDSSEQPAAYEAAYGEGERLDLTESEVRILHLMVVKRPRS